MGMRKYCVGGGDQNPGDKNKLVKIEAKADIIGALVSAKDEKSRKVDEVFHPDNPLRNGMKTRNRSA